MSLQVMDTTRQRTLAAHLAEVHQLDSDALDAIAQLATQLDGQAVLPVIGAGASYDCGMRLAKEISPELFHDYTSNPDYAPHEKLDPESLGDVAEAILKKTDQIRVVSDLAIPDEGKWKPSKEIGDHFCVYCVIARMVREGFIDKALGFNYDCGVEAAFDTEGFVYDTATPGKEWRDHARVIADAEANSETPRRGAFDLYKAHGCAVRYREKAPDGEDRAAREIIVCRSQLENWKGAGNWSRDAFRDQAKKHLLLLVGFSAQDPKFSAELVEVLEGIKEFRKDLGRPRVVAIDPKPDTEEIKSLIEIGLGEGPPHDGAVTQVCTDGSTATAAMLVLLTEMLRLRLEPRVQAAGLELPRELDRRIAALVVAVPTMLRWSYLTQGSQEKGFFQRANLMAKRGYVPLADPDMIDRTVELIAARTRLRTTLGMTEPETSIELSRNHGFLVDGPSGFAFLPVGVEHDRLVATCGVETEMEKIRATFNYPSKLECILISGDGSELRGVNVKTGARYPHDA